MSATTAITSATIESRLAFFAGKLTALLICSLVLVNMCCPFVTGRVRHGKGRNHDAPSLIPLVCPTPRNDTQRGSTSHYTVSTRSLQDRYQPAREGLTFGAKLLATWTREGVKMTAHPTQEERQITGQYEIEVLRLRQEHSIRTVDPWIHYMSAKRQYMAARKEADDIYLTQLVALFEKLQIDLGSREKAERANRHVERNGIPDGKPSSTDKR